MSILTLSGWNYPADGLAQLVPDAQYFEFSDYPGPDEAINALSAYRNVRHVIGWSTGGWLAMQAIHAGVLAPESLLLLATPYQFVSDERFKDGMGPTTFEQFRANYAVDPERTASRFHALIAKGDKDMRGVMSRLSHHAHAADTSRWLPWLDALASRNLAHVRIKTPSITLIHGENDSIVPVVQSAHLQAHHPQMKYELWQNTCHAPHLHDTERFLSHVRGMYAG